MKSKPPARAPTTPDEAMVSYVSDYDVTFVFALRGNRVEAKIIKLAQRNWKGPSGSCGVAWI